ncbi:MAG TPA: diguanylate cyclase, partial [Solirubrobacteraceae bacterium]|nr:diguanylate cyclase [Solirubrobacteraceae bacterium]
MHLSSGGVTAAGRRVPTRAHARLGGRPDAHTLAWSLVVAATFFGAGLLGRSVVGFHGTGAVVSPAVGIGIAAVVLGGRRMLPAVALGALVTMISLGAGLLAIVLGLLAATSKPLLAGELLARVDFDPAMRRTADVVAFVALAVVVATAVGAVFGTLSLLAAGSVQFGATPGIWRDLWLGSLTGALVVGGLILVFGGLERRMMWSRAALEIAAMSAIVGLASVLLLDRHGAVPDLVLPLLFVLAFAYRQRGAAIGTLFVSSVAIVLTAHGHGPFIGDSRTDSLIRAEAFVCVGGVTALLVAAALSERRLAEQALARLALSENALAEAQRVAHLGSFDIDLVARTAAWSDETFRILGRDPRTYTPTPGALTECVHPDDRERVRAYLAEADDDLGHSFVHRVIRPDGQVRTVELRFGRERDAAGRPVRIVGTCQDVTAVRLAEERFRALFKDAPYPLIVVDRAGEIVLGNARAANLFGAQDGLEGCAVGEFLSATGSAPDDWYSLPVAAADDERDAGGERELELIGRRRGGDEFPVEVTTTPLAAEQGPLVSVAIRDVTELRAAAEILNFQARHDPLTGLPNRLMFMEQLEGALARARRSGRSLAVVFIDLDDFKDVNDTRGHNVGDLLLKALTPRLSAAIRDGDMLGRLGGDEFVVLCEDLPSETSAMEVAQRLVEVARRPLEVAGHEHAVSLSAGVVLITDPSRTTLHDVLRDADAAMYTAKGEGKGRAAVFDES